MAEVRAGVTDLVLGAALAGCAVRLLRTAGVHRYWALTFLSAGAGSLVGAAHHLWFADSRRASNLSWLAVGVLVAVAISYLLAASATELLEPRRARLVIRSRIAGLLAYLAATVVAGIGRATPLVLCESVTMAAIVGLWLHALRARRPGAGRMVTGIAACALSAAFFLVPAGVLARTVGLDASSLQHLGQIPGLLVIVQVVAAGTFTGRISAATRSSDDPAAGERGPAHDLPQRRPVRPAAGPGPGDHGQPPVPPHRVALLPETVVIGMCAVPPIREREHCFGRSGRYAGLRCEMSGSGNAQDMT